MAGPVPDAAVSVFTLHSCGSAGRRLSRTMGKLPNARVARSGDQWEASTTHVVTPAFSRSIKIVCALAAGARIVRPSFVDHCVELGVVPPVPPAHLEWGADPTPSSDPRIRHDAAALWRSRRTAGLGGPLQGVSVLIVGELAPRARGAAGVISSFMAEQVLTAAGANVVTSADEASFALVTDAVVQHPLNNALRSKGIVCFGPAILVDLVARVQITPAEYLAFRDQLQLVAPSFSVDVVKTCRFIPLVTSQLGISQCAETQPALLQKEPLSSSTSRGRKQQTKESNPVPSASRTVKKPTPRRPRRSSARAQQKSGSPKPLSPSVVEKKPEAHSSDAATRTTEKVESTMLRVPLRRSRAQASSSGQIIKSAHELSATRPASARSRSLTRAKKTKIAKPANSTSSAKTSTFSKSTRPGKGASLSTTQPEVTDDVPDTCALPSSSGPSFEVLKKALSLNPEPFTSTSVDTEGAADVFHTPSKAVKAVNTEHVAGLVETRAASSSQSRERLEGFDRAFNVGEIDMKGRPVVPQVDDSTGAMLLLALAGGGGEGLDVLVSSPRSGEKRREVPESNLRNGGSSGRSEGSPGPEKRRRTLEPRREAPDEQGPIATSDAQAPLAMDFQMTLMDGNDVAEKASSQEKKDASPESPCRRQNASDLKVGAAPRLGGANVNAAEKSGIVAGVPIDGTGRDSEQLCAEGPDDASRCREETASHTVPTAERDTICTSFSRNRTGNSESLPTEMRNSIDKDGNEITIAAEDDCIDLTGLGNDTENGTRLNDLASDDNDEGANGVGLDDKMVTEVHSAPNFSPKAMDTSVSVIQDGGAQSAPKGINTPCCKTPLLLGGTQMQSVQVFLPSSDASRPGTRSQATERTVRQSDERTSSGGKTVEQVSTIVISDSNDSGPPTVGSPNNIRETSSANSGIRPVDLSASPEKPRALTQLLSQRKRPRRIVRESPPSDSEEDGEKPESSNQLPLQKLFTPPKEGSSLGDVSAGEEDAHSKPFSFGIPSPSFERGRIKNSNGAGTQPSRRRIQLCTPSAPAPRRSSYTRHRFNSDCESSVRNGTGLILNPIDSSVDMFTSGISFDDAHNSVLSLIGGNVTSNEVARLFPQAAEESPTENNEMPRTESRRQESSRNRNVPVFDDSPPDFFEDDFNLQADATNSGNPRVLEVTWQRSRSVGNYAPDGQCSAQPGFTLNTEWGDANSCAPILNLPKTISTIPEVLPSHLYSLASYPSIVNVAVGISEDDKLQDGVVFHDWLYGAELLDLDAETRERLLQNGQNLKGFDAGSCLKQMRDCNILCHFVSVSGLRPEKMRTVLGICVRLLTLGLTENMLSLFFGLLLQARDRQLENGRDPLCFVFSNSRMSSNVANAYLQFLWVFYLEVCRKQDRDGELSTFWKLFNENWVSPDELSQSNHGAVAPYVAEDKRITKLLDTLIVFGGLFAFQLTKPVEGTSVSFAPNWAFTESVLKSLVERKYPTVEHHRQALFKFLRRICTDFVDKFWKVEAEFVLKALDSVRSICVKFDSACSCSTIPPFLSQFKNISDLRSRHRSLPEYLRTECDCVIFLSWVLIAQDSKTASKLSAKIVRHSASFVKSKGCSKDPAKALFHHLGLILSISESIVKSGSGREDLLRAMLFSKVPDISTAGVDPRSFGPGALNCWRAVLETIKLRCRTLLASGNSIHVYSDYICSNAAAALQCLEKPETRFAGNIEKREAWRVQQRVIVDLVVKLLSAFVDVLRHLTQDVDQGSYTNHEAVDILLVGLSKFVGGLGRFVTGLVAQIRSNQSGAASGGRHAILSAVVSFVDQGLDLCTVHSHGQLRREEQGVVLSTQSLIPFASQTKGPVSGTDCFAKSVKKCMLMAFISMTQRTVSQAESKLDLDMRIVASRALARTVGLCCIGPCPDYTVHSSTSLLQVIHDANMTVLELGGAHRAPSISQHLLSGQGQRDAMITELLIQTEFWCVLLDSTWSRSLFNISERLEEIVFAIWVIVLVVTYSKSANSPLVKTLPALSYGIQCAASTSPNIGKWFYATQYGRKCKAVSSAVVGGARMSVTDLDGQERLEALVDCFSAILRSWVSAKVLNLLTFIRSYVTLNNDNKTQIIDQESSQSFFRPSRDFQDAEQFLLHTQVLSVLFVIHASLSLSSSQYRGGRVGNEKSVSIQFLTDIYESLQKALNKFRRKRSAVHEAAQTQIQSLVIMGLATVGHHQRDMQARVCFLRFVRICGNADNLCGLFTWNDETILPDFLKREPFMFTSVAVDQNSVARRKLVETSALEWRRLAFHNLVEDPISRYSITSQEFRNALRYMRDLLQPAPCANIQETGLWDRLYASVKKIGVRRQSTNFSNSGDIIRTLLQQMWSAVRFQIPEQDLSLVRVALLGSDA